MVRFFPRLNAAIRHMPLNHLPRSPRLSFRFFARMIPTPWKNFLQVEPPLISHLSQLDSQTQRYFDSQSHKIPLHCFPNQTFHPPVLGNNPQDLKICPFHQ